MSIEYFAAVDIDEAGTGTVRRELKKDGRFQMLPSSDPSRMLFRLTANSPRETWPEDLEVRFQKGEIWLTFHSASPDDQAAFIRLAESVLAGLGLAAAFSEA